MEGKIKVDVIELCLYGILAIAMDLYSSKNSRALVAARRQARRRDLATQVYWGCVELLAMIFKELLLPFAKKSTLYNLHLYFIY
jgi:hypothetical protein